MQPLPRVFDFSDYRQFLKTVYLAGKARNPGFSFRAFARRGQLGSPSHLKMVMDGKRGLSHRGLKKFIRALGISGAEAVYFENLVYLNQSTDLGEQTERMKRLFKISARLKSAAKALEARQYDLLSKWYYSAIRELVVLPDFREDGAWIARRLGRAIKPREARAGLTLLIELGLLRRNAAGRLELSEQEVTTEPGVRSVAVRNYHRGMIRRAGAAVALPRELRQYEALTIALSAEQAESLKNELHQFRMRLHEKYAQAAEPKSEVYQLNINFFPLTTVERKKP